ncbi:MAG: hypothetical protein ABIH91_01745, partial [Candidatus Omnitrophota bacterium]
YLIPFKIGVTNLGLVVDGKNFTRMGVYDELARLLHQRKIKSIEIKSGSTLAQIVGFFSVISLPAKDIFENGGVNVLFKKQQLLNFTIEELDYSAFLQESGQECKDVWGYMLKDAMQSNDQTKLNDFIDNFNGLIKRTNQNDIFETEEIPANLNEFLVSLKGKNKEQFAKCSKDLFLWLSRSKKSLEAGELAKLKLIFSGLSQEDLATLFWKGITQEEDFDSLSLRLFSKISEQKNPLKIAEDFLNKANAAQHLSSNSKVVKRVKSLLTATQDDQLSAVYRNSLESLIKGTFTSGVLFFDQSALRENYRYIALNILLVSEDKDSLQLAAEVLEKELANVFEENGLSLLKDIQDVLAKRKKENIKACIGLEKSFASFIENIILNGHLASEQEFLFEMVSSPSQQMNFYLDKIFIGEKVNKQVLSLFLRLFPAGLDAFYKRVDGRIQDTEFLARLIEALSQTETPNTISILEYIYSGANELVKVASLKAMRKLRKADTAFLTRQLNTDSFLLRSELLSVLLLDAQAKKEALDLLFNASGFLGSKNRLLMENMQIVFDLHVLDAAGRIKKLSCRSFFWNWKLRAKAKQILREWNAH